MRKDWRNFLPRIGALLGKLIAMRDEQAFETNRVGGVPTVRLITPRNVRLPTIISLPNLLINKPLVPQTVYHQGLLEQCLCAVSLVI